MYKAGGEEKTKKQKSRSQIIILHTMFGKSIYILKICMFLYIVNRSGVFYYKSDFHIHV